MNDKPFKGKAIYCPTGKAGEYAKYACNFYKGCSGMCTYCFNKKGLVKKVLGGDTSELKSCFKDIEHAKEVFKKELKQNLEELKTNGLFFSFTSDFLPETEELLKWAIEMCLFAFVPVSLLTKQTAWLTDEWLDYIKDVKDIAFGFTLTGHDEEEPGCATNSERIAMMRKLHKMGFKTYASIEPVITIDESMDMIQQTYEYCDLYKVGLESGKSYTVAEANDVINRTMWLTNLDGFSVPVYFKDSLLKKAGMKQGDIGVNTVGNDFNIFQH